MTLTREDNKQNRAAAYYMLIAMISFSLAPLVIDLNRGSETPFMFNALWTTGSVVFCMSYLVVNHSSLLFNKTVIKHIWRHVFSILILLAIISGFGYALFAWSTQFIDTSVATILSETWPIMTIYIIAQLSKNERRYQNLTGTKFIFLFLGLIGIAFVIASEAGGFQKLNLELKPTLVFGIMLALGSAFIASLAGFLFKWSTDLKQILTESGIEYPEHSLTMFCIIIGTIICYIPVSLISMITGQIREEELTLTTMSINIAGGVLIYGFGTLCWRKANLITTNLGVNAIVYFAPILTMFWLWLFSSIDIASPDYLIIGVIAIVAANLITNIEAEIRLGYRSFIFALWLCGLIVFFQDGRYYWTSEFYFEAVAASSTLFILILSFRISRFVTRTTDEEKCTLSIVHAVNSNRWLNGKIMVDYILRLDAPKSPEELKHAYYEAKTMLREAQQKLVVNADNGEDIKEISKIEADLDLLAHSKQQGTNIGELFALLVFAFISICFALFSRPVTISETAGFFLDIFSFLFSAVSIFLIFNVLDLHRDRASPILKQLDNRYDIVFRDATDRQFELYLSGIISILIIIAYGVLIW